MDTRGDQYTGYNEDLIANGIIGSDELRSLYQAVKEMNDQRQMAVNHLQPNRKLVKSKRLKSPTEWQANTLLGEIVELAGFEYLPDKDIICSQMENFQRKLGYCKLFDEAAFAINSIIDAEPIIFVHDDHEWMIELWKGQYGIESGGEIGIYRRPKNAPISFSEVFGGKHYQCIGNKELQPMYFDMKWKLGNNSVFSMGEERHWWLTGFKWGMFVNPEDLCMDIDITFTKSGMLAAFIKALEKLGYYCGVDEPKKRVSFTFDKPKNPQSLNREKWRDSIQRINRGLVAIYIELKAKLGIVTNDPDEICNKLLNNGGLLGEFIIKSSHQYFSNRCLLG